ARRFDNLQIQEKTQLRHGPDTSNSELKGESAMSLSRIKQVGYLVPFVLALVVSGCHGKTAAAPTPPPPAPATPPPPAPTITLRAQPASIERGSSTTLQWEARNASIVTISPGVGDVPVEGNRAVNPASSVTYT